MAGHRHDGHVDGGHNGIIAIQALKRIDHRAKIVVCSATSDQSFVTGAVALGIEAYLNKPIDVERLIATIRAALAKAESSTRALTAPAA